LQQRRLARKAVNETTASKRVAKWISQETLSRLRTVQQLSEETRKALLLRALPAKERPLLSCTKRTEHTSGHDSGWLTTRRQNLSKHILHEVTDLFEGPASKVAHALHCPTEPVEGCTGKVTNTFCCAAQGITHIVQVRRQGIPGNARSDTASSCHRDSTAIAHATMLVCSTVGHPAILWKPLLKATILWAAALRASVPRAAILRASVLRAAILRASVLRTAILRASVLRTAAILWAAILWASVLRARIVRLVIARLRGKGHLARLA